MNIHSEINGGIARVTMDDGKANVMDADFFATLSETMDRLEKASVKVVIIAGRAGFFSGGLDLKYLARLSPEGLNRLITTQARTLLRLYLLPIPTIAVCTGHAIGAGAMLAFCCDVRLAVDGPYRIHVKEVSAGVPLMSWMLLIARAAIPQRWQLEALLHARAYNPGQAMERNLFDALVEAGTDATAVERSMAEGLLHLNTQAYGISKRRMRAGAVHDALERLSGELPTGG